MSMKSFISYLVKPKAETKLQLWSHFRQYYSQALSLFCKKKRKKNAKKVLKKSKKTSFIRYFMLGHGPEPLSLFRKKKKVKQAL